MKNLHSRLALFLALGVLIVAISQSFAVTECIEQYAADINGCGATYPPESGGFPCPLISSSPPNESGRDCCALGLRQHVYKEWYDCNGDSIADCEYDTWFTQPDETCDLP